MYLNVMIEAPVEPMSTIIEKHDTVRQLVDNGWIHLFAMDANGRVSHKHAGDSSWSAIEHPLQENQACAQVS